MLGIIILGGVALVCLTLDLWLGRHPFKRADAKAEKYRYRGF